MMQIGGYPTVHMGLMCFSPAWLGAKDNLHSISPKHTKRKDSRRRAAKCVFLKDISFLSRKCLRDRSDVKS